MDELLIECRDVLIQHLDEILITIEDLKVYRGDRIGLVAPNGKGKTTLLNFLAGHTKYKGLHRVYGSIGFCKQQEEPSFRNELNEKDRHILKIPKRQEMSGGELAKLKFLETLEQYPDILLLDEPSAHMDSNGLEFIVESLEYYYGAFILVSHDRFLLNQLVEEIWEIEDGKIKIYQGNYDQYEEKKQLEYEQAHKSYEAVQKEKTRLQSALQEKKKKALSVEKTKGIREYRAKPSMETKSKQTAAKNLNKAARNLEKRIEKIQEVILPTINQPIQFETSKLKEMHTKFPIVIDYVDIFTGNQLLIKKVNLQVPLGNVVSISGTNGTGKSTLLKAIYHKEKGINLSNKAKIGYFDQLLPYSLHNKNISVLEYCKKQSNYDESFLRNILSRIHFKDNDFIKKMNQLSGGELTRLSLLLLFIQDYNLLLLDEPNNFLDITTIKVLEEFIIQFPGTIVCISHDKNFINNISDKIYEVKNQTLIRLV